MLRRRSVFAAGLLLLTMAVPVSAAAPTNDHPDGAIVIDALPASIAVDLTEATVDGDPQACGGGNSASVWYRYTPPADEFLTISLAADPWMGAVQIAPDVPEAVQGCVFAGQSTTFLADGGRPYLLQVSTDGSPTTMDLSAQPPLGNDRFADAETIAGLPATVGADLTRTTATGDPSTCSQTGNGAWFAFTPDTDLQIELNADANQSAIVTVTGPSIDDHIACLFSWSGPIRTELQAGTTYHFLLAAGSPFGGSTSMSIVEVPPPPPPPANDDPADAVVVAALPFEVEVDMTSASGDPTAFGFCFDEQWPAVWYRFTPTDDVVLDADVSGGAGQTRAAFFWEAENDDDNGVGGCTADGGEGRILAHAGVTYRIGLAVPPWVDGTAGLHLTGSPPPTVALTVDASGSLERVSGTAVISGTVTCSGTDLATINLHVRQRVGRTGLISGRTGGEVRCSATPVPWTMRVRDEDAPFGSGSVSVEWYAAYGDWSTRVETTGESIVKLRGK
jgi:hypothetical protein